MLVFTYGVVLYVFFLGTYTYATGFVGNIGVPRGLDSPATGPVGESLLLATFLINHFELFGLRLVWAKLMGSKLGKKPA